MEILISIIAFPVVFYFVGTLVGFKYTNEDNYYTIFYNKAFLGLIITLFLFSVYKTTFFTINILLLFIIPLLLLRKPFFNDFFKEGYKKMLPALFVLLGIGIMQYFFYYPDILCPYPGYFGDHLFYGDVAVSIHDFGVENTLRADNIFAEKSTVSPYHYWDIWISVLSLNILKISPIISYEIIYISVFGFLMYIGILGFIKRENHEIHCLNYVLAFVFLFISGISIAPEKPEFISIMSKFSGSIFGYPKLFITALILVWSFSNYTRKNKGFIIISSTILFSISNIAHFPGVIVAGLFTLIISKSDKKQLMYLILFAVSFGLFYKFLGVQDSVVAISLSKNISTKVNLFVGELIAVTYYHFVFFIPLLFKAVRDEFIEFIKKYGWIFIFYLCFLGVSWLFSVAVSEITNSYQFLSNLLIPLINFLIVIIISILIKVFSQIRIVMLSILLLFICFRLFFMIENRQTQKNYWCSYYSMEYINSVTNELKMVDNRTGGVFMQDEQSSKTQKGMYQFNHTGYFIQTIYPGYLTINFSAPILMDEYKINTYYHNLFKNSYVNKYLDKQQKSINDGLLELIEYKGIKFLIVEKGAKFPIEADLSIKKRITDQNSGEMFILLN